MAPQCQNRILRGITWRIAIAWLVALAVCSLPNVGLWSSTGHANTGLFELYGRHVRDGGVPYRSGFAFEYPPGALPPLVLPAFLPGPYPRWFHVFEFVFLLAAVAAVAAARNQLAPAVAAALAPALLGQLALNSFDLWPVALAAVAVALVARRRPLGGFGFLAASTAAKLYPVLLAPVLYLYVERTHGRHVAQKALAVGAVVFVVIFLPFAILAPHGLAYSTQEQATRGLQVESLGGAVFGVARQLGASVHVVVSTSPFSYDIGGRAADIVATLTSALVLVAVYLVHRTFRLRAADLDAMLIATAAAAVGFVAFAKVLSPQYLLLLVPLVPLAGRARPAVLLGIALALTQVWARFPQPFAQVSSLRHMIWVTFARNLVLVALFAELLRELRLRRASPAPESALVRPRSRSRRAPPRSRP